MAETIVTFQTSGQKFMKIKNDESSVVTDIKQLQKIFNVYLLTHSIHNSWFKDLSSI